MINCFLSAVCVIKDQSEIVNILEKLSFFISKTVSDYEIILIDNSGKNLNKEIYEKITGDDGFPNIQIFVLTKKVDLNTASWVGLENSLGDYVITIDYEENKIEIISDMLKEGIGDSDVVFANNIYKSKQKIMYLILRKFFSILYKYLENIDPLYDAPKYRLLNRKVVNYILQHPHPSITYRHLPLIGGFRSKYLTYKKKPKALSQKSLLSGLNKGLRLLVSTTETPMRIVTSLSIFGAFSNIIYSFYVIGIAILKDNVEPGWVTLSLQQAGMFFLISIVLLILGEYILNVAKLSNEGPSYHITQEFYSEKVSIKEKLNIK